MPRSWRSQIADEVRATSMMKPKAIFCPNCQKSVCNIKAHYIPGNFVTPEGWACKAAESK
jgi:hypothetical protein